MKKKISLTLLLALFVIAAGWTQKRHYSYDGDNRHGQYRNDACHSNGRGQGHQKGKHKKSKQHKHKHHGHDNWNGYGYQKGGCNDRSRDNGYRDRDNNWGNSGSQTGTPTRPGRNASPRVRTAPRPVATGHTVQKPKAATGTMKTTQGAKTRSGGSTVPARRAGRPGN